MKASRQRLIEGATKGVQYHVDLELRTDEFFKRLQDALTPRMDAIGRDIKEAAKALAPTDTGALKEGIFHKVSKPKKFTGSMRVYVKAHTSAGKRSAKKLGVKASGPYSHYVEYGTKRARGHAFMRPALEAIAAQAESKFKDII